MTEPSLKPDQSGFKLPITYRAIPAKYLFFCGFFLFMLWVTFYAAEDVSSGVIIMRLIFGLGAIVLGVQALPNAAYLKLTQEGFETRALYRSHFVNWSDVESFGTTRIGKKNLFSWKNNFVSVNMKNSKIPIPGAIDPMSCNPQELADFMNALRNEYG
ncbi:hypothetical protein ACJ3XI_04870 [Litorimonas sp. RW-G-Af-16]|uniref:hypothetical protein n=1 Tax=Litorimonas sp. RW-G-Af-16 TaxID=3241168 RepID=UPI00390CB504